MKMERLGITMLINDKSQLKRNVEQIGFQLALKTSKSLSWPDRLRHIVLHTYVMLSHRQQSDHISAVMYAQTYYSC